jgi:predicted nucleic acid-binding Zn ribbon protein
MKNDDRALSEKLNNIDARLRRQERATRLGFAGLTVLAAMALVILAYYVARL